MSSASASGEIGLKHSIHGRTEAQLFETKLRNGSCQPERMLFSVPSLPLPQAVSRTIQRSIRTWADGRPTAGLLRQLPERSKVLHFGPMPIHLAIRTVDT